MASQNIQTLHPCQTCGACCAAYRVEFYWLAAEPGTLQSVPQEFVEDLNQSHRCMKGTNSKHNPKCSALSGRVGEYVSCQIYLNRPSPCHAFKASHENGLHYKRCDEARAKHGLAPLTRHDWKPFVQLKESL